MGSGVKTASETSLLKYGVVRSLSTSDIIKTVIPFIVFLKCLQCPRRHPPLGLVLQPVSVESTSLFCFFFTGSARMHGSRWIYVCVFNLYSFYLPSIVIGQQAVVVLTTGANNVAIGFATFIFSVFTL